MKRKITVEDIYKLSYVSDAQISPAGKAVAFVKMVPDKAQNSYNSKIWIVNEKSRPRCITDDFIDAAMPRWSPTNDKILFLSAKEGISQLFLYSLDNRAIEQVTFDKAGKNFPVWSPDGSKIAFIATFKPNDRRKETIEVKTLKYKLGSGLIDFDTQKHIMVLDVDCNEITRITPEDFSLDDPEYNGVFNPSWSGDGRKLVFASKVQDPKESDKYPWKADVFIVDSDGGEPRPIKPGIDYASKPIWSADNESIIFIGNRNEYQRATTQRLCRVKISGDEPEYLTKGFDRNIGDYTTSDFGLGYSEANPVLSRSRNKIYFHASDEGKANVFSLDLASNEVERVIGGERRVYGFTLSKDERKIAFCYSAADTPNDIAVFDLDTAKEARLTQVNKEIMDSVSLSIPEKISFETDDGMEVHGWVMKPADYESGNTYPGVLNIHGGPALQWGWTFSFESQILAAEGYGVMYCNPRGSRTCGQQYTAAIQNNWGGMDFDDFMRFTDKALDYGFIDPEKLAVMGNSYGGFMTNWIVSHTDRFKAAMSMGSVSNFMTMFGVSDTGYIVDQLLGLDEIEDLTELWKFSPLAYAQDINTPLLFLHGAKDNRCPIDQAEQLYIRLKSMDKETEMVRFQDSEHFFHRIDKPSIRAIRLAYILEYFGRYLLGK